MFSASDAYERFMGRWSRAVARLFVQFAGVGDGEDILDVGCGTGALATTVATIAPSSRIVGIDPAASYIAFAKLQSPSKRLTYEVGDATQMRFASGSFDRTLSLFNLNFIQDSSDAVREMIRVTRSNGHVAAAVWDYGQGMEMLRWFWDEAIALNPASDAKDERHMPLSRSGELAALWRARGLIDVREESLTIDMPFCSFDDYWLPFLEGQGPAGAYVASLEPDDVAALHSRLQRRLAGEGPEQPVVLTARAWAVRGTVPS